MMMRVGGPPAKRAKGKDGKGITTMLRDDSVTVGEVRYCIPSHAKVAVQRFNGKALYGSKLTVELDPKSSDQSKVLIHGIPDEAQWQEVKDHFSKVGEVAFAEVRGGGRRNKTACGEVRFEDPVVAARALQQFNGTELMGCEITVNMCPASKDNTKLLVTGLSASCGWQDLKDHFAQVGGPIAFCTIKKGAGSGKAEVRYEDPAHAKLAAATLNGSQLLGHTVSVELDDTSHDGTKLNVWGVSPAAGWQDVKDHFQQVGEVAYAKIRVSGEGKGPGGKGLGKAAASNVGAELKQMQQMMHKMQQMMTIMASNNMVNTFKKPGKGRGKW